MPTLSIFFGIIVRMWHDDHRRLTFMWNTKALRRWSTLPMVKFPRASYRAK